MCLDACIQSKSEFPCPHCEACYTRKTRLNSHLEDKHGHLDQKEEDTGVTMLGSEPVWISSTVKEHTRTNLVCIKYMKIGILSQVYLKLIVDHQVRLDLAIV